MYLSLGTHHRYGKNADDQSDQTRNGAITLCSIIFKSVYIGYVGWIDWFIATGYWLAAHLHSCTAIVS